MDKPNDKEKWRGLSLEMRRRELFDNWYVPHPMLNRIIDEISRMAERCKNEKKGQAMLVCAGSGGGKTYIAKMFSRMRPEDHSGDVSVVPVVTFSIPSSPTQRSLGSALLQAMGDPKFRSGSAQDLFDRAILQLRQIQSEIIFIDNVHDIPERRGSKGVLHLGNWVRDLIDSSKCFVVLLGTPAAVVMTNSNSQLRRRTMKLMMMNPFGIRETPDEARFKRFLNTLDKKLPLAEMSGLNEQEISRSIFYATFGIMDCIVQLIQEALAHALDDSREKILKSDLEKAFEKIYFDAASNCNPFSPGGPARILDGDGEPFHKWFDSSNPAFP